jgi:hypothetical protein
VTHKEAPAPKLCSTYNTNNTRDDPPPLGHTPSPDIATTKPETEKQGKQKGTGTCKEVAGFIRYYASTQSRARTPEERSVVTCTTASPSPARSRHRRMRASPKLLLRWLAAVELGTRTVRVEPSSSPPSNCSNQGGRTSRPRRATRPSTRACHSDCALGSGALSFSDAGCSERPER